MTVPTIAARSRPAAPAAVAGGLLAITLAAGCGSSGGGGSGSFSGPSASASATSTLEPPSSAASSAPQTGSPFASTTPTASANALRDFHDASTGLSLSVPVGYVLATTPAEAAARFPPYSGWEATSRPDSLTPNRGSKSTTVMIAFHPPIGGVSDNVGLIKLANDGAVGPGRNPESRVPDAGPHLTDRRRGQEHPLHGNHDRRPAGTAGRLRDHPERRRDRLRPPVLPGGEERRVRGDGNGRDRRPRRPRPATSSPPRGTSS